MYLRYLLLFSLFLGVQCSIKAQFNIGSNVKNPYAVLQLQGADSSQGLIVPYVTTVNRPSPSDTTQGMLIFNLTDSILQYCDGETWLDISPFTLQDRDADTKIQVEEGTDEDIIRFDIRGTQRMIIDSTGNVGIGTTSPSQTLEVVNAMSIKNVADANSVFIGNLALAGSEHLQIGNRTVRTKAHQDQLLLSGDNLDIGGRIHLYGRNHADNGSIRFGVEGNKYAYLEGETGHFGIGTTNPDTTLHIEGSLKMVDGNEANGYLLQSDANGVGTWVDPSSVITADDGDWVVDNDTLYSAPDSTVTIKAGMVGIGTTTPTYNLDIIGNNDAKLYIQSTGGPANLAVNRTDGKSAALTAGTSFTGFYFDHTGSFAVQGMSNPHSASVFPSASNWIITGSGNIGINTSSPTAKFHIHNDVTGNDSAFVVTNSGKVGIGTTTVGSNSYLDVVNSTGYSADFSRGIQVGGVSGNSWYFSAGNTTIFGFSTVNESSEYFFDNTLALNQQGYSIRNLGEKLIFRGVKSGVSNLQNMMVLDSGKVGIGTNSPDTTLHIEGGIKIVDGNQANGYLLQSDANGVGTWVDPSSVTTADDNDWVVDNDTLYSAHDSTVIIKNGNVGIGTLTPDALLHVDGGAKFGKAQNNISGEIKLLGGANRQSRFYFGDQNDEEIGGLLYDHTNNFMVTRVNGRTGGFQVHNTNGNSNAHLISLNYPDGGVTSTDAVLSIRSNPGVANALHIENTVNSEIFVVNKNGSVGLSTSSPTAKFHINNDVTGSDSAFVVTSTGNAGIGTANPQTKLHVKLEPTPGSGEYEGIRVQNTANLAGDGVFIKIMEQNNTGYGAEIGIVNTNSNPTFLNPELVFRVTDNNSTNILERMRINKNGNVGIGTTSPDEKLHIEGSLKIVDGNQANGYLLQSDANGIGTWVDPSSIITADDGDWILNNDTLISAPDSTVKIQGGELHVGDVTDLGDYVAQFGGSVYIEGPPSDGRLILASRTINMEGSNSPFYLTTASSSSGILMGYASGNRSMAVGSNGLISLGNFGGMNISSGDPSSYQIPAANLHIYSSSAQNAINITDQSGVATIAVTDADTSSINGSLKLSASKYILNDLDSANGVTNLVWSNNDTMQIVTLEEVADSLENSWTTLVDTDGDTKIQVEEGDADEDWIRFDTKGTERMVIDSTGKVGIGMNPTYPLDVNGNSRTKELIVESDNPRIFLKDATAGHGDFIFYPNGNQMTIYGDGTSNEILFKETLSGETILDLDLDNHEVGIGTSEPAAKFHIHNDNTGAHDSTLVFTSGGRMGIGTTNPSTALHIIETNNTSNKFAFLAGHSISTEFFTLEPMGGYGTGVVGLGYHNQATYTETISNYGSIGVVGATVNTMGGRTTIGVHGLSSGNSTMNGNGGNYIYGGFFKGLGRAGITDYQGTTIGVRAVGDISAVTALAGSVYAGHFSSTGAANTTSYGIYASSTGGSTNYGVYSANGTNYFNGNVGIGTNAPANKLHVSAVSDPVKIQGLVHDATLDTVITIENGILHKSAISTLSPTSLADVDGDTKVQVEEGGADEDWIRFDTKGNQRMVIDSTGNVGIGTGTPSAKFMIYDSYSPHVRIASGNNLEFSLENYNTSPNANIAFKTGTGSINAPAAIQSYDQIGAIRFYGHDGTNFIQAAAIEGLSDGTAGTNDMGGRLLFKTTPDGSSTAQIRMRILNNGFVGIGITPQEKLHVDANSDSLQIDDLAAGTLSNVLMHDPTTGKVVTGAVTNLDDATINTVATNYTATSSDQVILVDASGGDVTITLPATGAVNTGKRFQIKKVEASANNVIIDANGAETIDGSATITITAAWQGRTLVSDGSNWFILY